MTETTSKNPFRPGVGIQPRYLAGRDKAIANFRAILRSSPDIPANMRVTGLRGVGKTVLLHKFAEQAHQDGWFAAVLELQPRHNSDKAIKELLLELMKQKRQEISTLEKVRAVVGKAAKTAANFKLEFNNIGLSYGGTPDEDKDLMKELLDVTNLAIESGYEGFILMLDEAQIIKDDTSAKGEHPLSILIATVAGLQKNPVPFGLVICGLPPLASNLLRARSYSERMFRGELVSSLDEQEAREAFTKPLEDTGIIATDKLVDEVVKEVEGYPYFIQLWGAGLCDAAYSAGTVELTPELLEVIQPDIYKRLDLDFYQPRVETLTPAEQDVLLSTVKCKYPPIITADLGKANDKTVGNINVLLGRLAQSGVIYRLRKGQYEYTAPKFRQYLERHPQ